MSRYGRSRLLAVPPALLLAAAGGAAAQAPEPPAEPAILGAPAAFGVEEERVAIAEGAHLRASPDPRSASLATVDAVIELPVVERRGEWTRVRYGGLVGWVRAGEPAPEGQPEVAPESPSGTLFHSREELRPTTLARIEERLGPAHPDRPALGPWALYTDLEDAGLLEFLDRVAAELPGLYRERYGIDAGPAGGEAILLFAEEADYRRFAEESGGLTGIGEGGHTGDGVAALYAGSRDRAELASLLVHELTHLLNARALGQRTPPWLEEGLANDLAFSEIGRGGRLEPGSLGGASHRQVRVDPGRKMVVRTSWDGGMSAFVTLRQSLQRGELPSVHALAHLPWRALVDPAGRSLRYAHSTFLVRYLVDREPEAFRRYLGHFASGGTDDPRLLVDVTGEDWAALDQGFRGWLAARAEELGLLHDGPQDATRAE